MLGKIRNSFASTLVQQYQQCNQLGAPSVIGISQFIRQYSTYNIDNETPVEVINPEGKYKVVVTKNLPGTNWIEILKQNNCQIHLCRSEKTILDVPTIKKLIGSQCDGVIGQLTEDWSEELFSTLKAAGGTSYSNYAVGYNNVKVPAATANGIAVGNTPGVLTETTAELAAALTLAAARRVVESDKFMRAHKYKGWLPDLFVGALLQRQTVGIIGAGRIGAAYARMMVEGHKMNLVYFDPYPNTKLEQYVADYSALLDKHGEPGVSCKRVETMNEVLQQSNVVSLHCNLDDSTRHLINTETLNMMKPDAVLVNAARGPCINEAALLQHLQKNPGFRAGLDVFEFEPDMVEGLEHCDNAVIVPHIASASMWTRSGMASLAAANVALRLQNLPAYNKQDVLPYVDGPVNAMPRGSPSIVNAKELNIPTM